MLGEPKALTTNAQWHELRPANPVQILEPRVFVLPVVGGMLFRVVVPGNPVVFVPNVTVDDIEGSPSGS